MRQVNNGPSVNVDKTNHNVKKRYPWVWTVPKLVKDSNARFPFDSNAPIDKFIVPNI
jgi:hypothetical protein